MKKAILMLLILSLIGCAAPAERLEPLPGFGTLESFDNCTLTVSVGKDCIDGNTLRADLYDRQIYAAADVEKLQVGDTVVFMGEEQTVRTIVRDYSLFINMEPEHEDGIGFALVPDDPDDVTLYPGAKDGSYTGFYYELPNYLEAGRAELTLSDAILYKHWVEEEDGSISDDMSSANVTPAELKALLDEEIYVPEELREDIDDDTTPIAVIIRTEDGKVVELTIEHTP